MGLFHLGAVSLCVPEGGKAMPSAAPRWTFGPFLLDPAHACLWRGTAAVALPPKVFDVLHHLVTHPDRLVTKDELLDAVWPETAVSEAVVRVAIGALRRTLGDTAQAPRYIATVPRRGYRFVAPVVEHHEVIPGPTGAPPLETPDTPHHQAGVPRTPALPPPPGRTAPSHRPVLRPGGLDGAHWTSRPRGLP